MPLVNIFKCSVYLFRNVRGKTLSAFFRGVRSLKSIGPVVRKPGELPSFALLLLLLFLLLLTYPLSMVLVEMVPALNSTSFLLVMLKYVVGTSHHLFVPLGILVIRADLRGIVVDIYRCKVAKRTWRTNTFSPFQEGGNKPKQIV